MSLLSLQVQLERETDLDREAAWKQLEQLKVDSRISEDLRKRILQHLLKYNLGQDWIEDGEYLIKSATEEIHPLLLRQKQEEEDDQPNTDPDDDWYRELERQQFLREEALDKLEDHWDRQLGRKRSAR